MHNIVLFGATGDLSKKKLIPALARISAYKDFHVIGFGRKPFSQKEFTKFIHQCAESAGVSFSTSKKISFEYIQSEMDDMKGYKTLNRKASASAFLYLALPPELQLSVSKKIIKSGLVSKKNDRRLVFEKPFGQNSAEAVILNSFLTSKLREDQILRVDHYAGKETLLDLERSGRIGLPTFIASTETITSVDIRFRESISANMRGGFYDSVGALFDVAQNHMVHMLITFLTAFGEPCVYDDSGMSTCVISSSVSPVLQQIRSVLSSSLTVTGTPMVGQYKGFREAVGVNPKSKTETYFKFELALKNPNKYIHEMEEKVKVSEEARNSIKRIYTIFKNSKILFSGGKALSKDDVSITLNMKRGSYKLMVSKSCGKDAYDEIFTSLMEGNWNRFISFDQVQAGWRVVEAVKRRIKGQPVEYAVGTEPTA